MSKALDQLRGELKLQGIDYTETESWFGGTRSVGFIARQDKVHEVNVVAETCDNRKWMFSVNAFETDHVADGEELLFTSSAHDAAVRLREALETLEVRA